VIAARNNTPAARAARRPQVLRRYDQAEARQRRRSRLPLTLPGGWSLAAEVAEIVGPLAERVAAVPDPSRFWWRWVDDVALAVHGVVHAAVGVLAEADARRRTRHLAADDRGRSIRALVDLAERPELPDITDAALADGSWAAALTALAEPYSADLSGLLGRAASPAVSDRIVAALREVDAAAHELDCRLTRNEAARATKRAKAAIPTNADRARAELAALGITT
jgi:hypothetical protein